MRNVRGPYKEQKDWVYIRVPKQHVRFLQERDKDYRTFHGSLAFGERAPLLPGSVGGTYFQSQLPVYDDSCHGARVISSKRVEEAVEIYDFVKMCQEEQLEIGMSFVEGVCTWEVYGPKTQRFGVGDSLRAAYFKYQKEAQEAGQNQKAAGGYSDFGKGISMKTLSSYNGGRLDETCGNTNL